jgi:hypothetical protein
MHPHAAFTPLDVHTFAASELTRGPWDPAHQHAGPPSALACRAIELAAAEHGLTHLSRFTANLLRPVPIGEVTTRVQADYVGKNTGHFSGELIAHGKPVLRFTALVQRENPIDLPTPLIGHPWPSAPRTPEESLVVHFPFASRAIGYNELVENRQATGTLFKGPCAIWFRLEHPLVAGETPSPYQRVAVAADSGNGISAILDFNRYSFINSDLTINWLRRPQGEWVCLEAKTWFGENGCGLAESALYDQVGLVGRATQSLSVRER